MNNPFSAYEGDSSVRFGFYLRPSAPMCQAHAAIHALLSRQYGNLAVTAGAFMPHATIKGFFRSDAPVQEMIAALDEAMAGQKPFTVVNNGPIAYGRSSIVLNVQQDEFGETNPAMQRLHEAAFSALEPFVHPDCNFTPVEWVGGSFFAHLTLLQSLPRPEFHEEILSFIQDLEPIGPRRFPAEYVHLYAFRSDDWYGDWGATLRWELLHSWKLGG